MGDERDAARPEARILEAPGMSLRNSGENSPDTVEMLTPTFSNTRPRMTEIVAAAAARRAASRCARSGPARRSGEAAPANSSSIASNAAQSWSRSAANQASARATRSGSGGNGGGSSLIVAGTIRFGASASASAIAPASATLSDRAAPAQRNDDACRGGAVHGLGHAGAFAARAGSYRPPQRQIDAAGCSPMSSSGSAAIAATAGEKGRPREMAPKSRSAA